MSKKLWLFVGLSGGLRYTPRSCAVISLSAGDFLFVFTAEVSTWSGENQQTFSCHIELSFLTIELAYRVNVAGSREGERLTRANCCFMQKMLERTETKFCKSSSTIDFKKILADTQAANLYIMPKSQRVWDFLYEKLHTHQKVHIFLIFPPVYRSNVFFDVTHKNSFFGENLRNILAQFRNEKNCCSCSSKPVCS